jgi:hypothetical protein
MFNPQEEVPNLRKRTPGMTRLGESTTSRRRTENSISASIERPLCRKTHYSKRTEGVTIKSIFFEGYPVVSFRTVFGNIG